MSETRMALRPPFFEIGPKNYLYGDSILELALIADELSLKHNVPVIFTPPYADIRRVAENTRNLTVFAPHMDELEIGRGLASILPESVQAAGAEGVLLNHVEKPLTFAALVRTVARAKGLGMATLLLADSIVEAQALALLDPEIITAEPAELIGTSSQQRSLDYVHEAVQKVREINKDIYVLIGAGISSGQDVYDVILAGADASGSSSAVALAADPRSLIDEMLGAARQAWDTRQAQA